MGLWILMVALATGPEGEITEIKWAILPSQTICEVTGDALTAHLTTEDMAVIGYECRMTGEAV